MGLKPMSVTQPSILGFMTRRSSTLRDSLTEQTDDESYESAAEDTPKLRRKPTEPLDDASPALANKLEFSSKNYELCPITPGGAEDGTGQVMVKLPVKPSFKGISTTVNKPARRQSLRSKIPTARANSQANQARLGKGVSKKRLNTSGEKSAVKVNRVKSPEVKSQSESESNDEAGASSGAGTESETSETTEMASANDETKVEDVTAKSDDLSSLSILPGDESLQRRLADDDDEEEDEPTDATLDETVIRAEDETIVQQDPVVETEAESLVEQADELQVGGAQADPAATTTPAGVVIIKEYDSDEKGEPDKPATPPRDETGHMAGVQGVTPSMRVDSNITAEGSIMKKLSKDLINKSLETAGVMNTVEKKKSGEEID